MRILLSYISVSSCFAVANWAQTIFLSSGKRSLRVLYCPVSRPFFPSDASYAVSSSCKDDAEESCDNKDAIFIRLRMFVK